MLRKYCLMVLLVLFMVQTLQIKVNAQNSNLPKAPDWEFGFENVAVLKKLGITADPKTKFDSRYDNQVVINSWGYKAGNFDEIKDLIPEPLYNILKHPEIWGTYRINETAYMPIKGTLYDLYVEATKKYKGEPYLDEAGWLRNYKAGRPFPDVDVENDTQAALKLVWNWIKRCRLDDDTSLDSTIDLVDRGKRHKHVTSDSIKVRFSSRFIYDPKPLYLPNPRKYEYLYASANTRPYNVAGTIALLHRYDIPNRNDDMWIYVPSLRRVRRMSTAERQDKMSGGKDFVWDSVETFDGAIGNYNFEYVGTKMMLLPLCSSNMPSNVSDGYLNGVDDYWQRRKTYILRAIPKEPVNISEMVLYMDAEEFRSNLGYVSDTKGRPWLYQQYQSNKLTDGGVGLANCLAIDLITRHSSKNWITNNQYCLGFVPDNFQFDNLKRRFLVR